MSSADTTPSSSLSGTVSNRLLSLDALRGFDMFWIVGAEEIVHALRETSNNSVFNFLAGQMTHKDWAGFAFYDLIFPMFVFIVGVSLVFSLGKLLEKEGPAGAMKRIFKRALLLYALGIFCYGGFSTPIDKIRLLGVLQRIALAYLFASLVFCYFKTKGRIIICASLLIGYWALMTFVPVPTTDGGVVVGNFDEGKNLANYIDRQYLPFRKWDGDHDPEGLLSTMTAIASCLLGVFAGTWLKDGKAPAARKAVYLLGAGVALAALGWLWNFQFPVVKKIWTSSFVLVAGGYSCMLLALFYQIVDVWKIQAWAQPFVWIGTNAITIYLAHDLVDFGKIAQRLVGGEKHPIFHSYQALVLTCVVSLLIFLFCRFLYRRKIFLRV
jgi:predicted acyltransferase